MPSRSVTLHRLVNRSPAVYEASYGEIPTEIRLDTSALLKLEGEQSYENLERILISMPKPVADAAQRLLDTRHDALDSDKLMVTITALDMA